ncbi:MAG: cytochrome C biogenesis protein ResC, partial [Thermoanaerobaculales bacterium]
MSEFGVEAVLHWTAAGLYILATIAIVSGSLFEKPERSRWGLWIAGLGLAPHSLALLLRWQAAGHGPYMMRYEVLSSDAWVIVVVLLVFLWRKPNWSPVAAIVLPIAFLMIALAVFSNPEIRTLPPTLRSVWL